ncbi:MAG: dipeptidase [Bacteroidia bacterium]|nr:dipeptidase [Bacteroidia bacterium]
MHAALLNYITAHRQRFLDELFDWLRIPSVSAQPQHRPDMDRAAQWLADRLSELGPTTVELLPTPGLPIVYAEFRVGPDAPTVLIYGHYDVQPAEPFELWESPPFEPRLGLLGGEEKIFARGACDDKGQVYMHVKATEALLRNGGLPCNLKFFIEGEEEVGSEHLAQAILDHKDRLACDVVLISDTAMIANDHPSITVGLRGIAYMEVSVYGPNRDLHSGVYGGAVANPINVLCELIAQLKDEQGRITIPGFYDAVEELSAEERAEMARIHFDLEAYKAALNLPAVSGEAGYTTLERGSIRPTLDVNGIWGGYQGQGSKTVLPAEAHAKISMRLVPNQDPATVAQQFADYLRQLAPPTVRIEVRELHGGQPFVMPTGAPAYKAAEAALTQTYGTKPIPAREGGSIPIVATFARELGVDVVLLGFGLNSDALHSPNENFGTFNYFKGIESLALFHHHLSAQPRA